MIFFGFFQYLVLKSESVYKRCCYASVSDKSIIVDSYQQICLFSKKLGDYLIKIYCHLLESFFFLSFIREMSDISLKRLRKVLIILKVTTNKSGIYIP